MKFAETANNLFDNTIKLYHLTDDVDAQVNNPYQEGTVEAELFTKCWIDTVQWHLEDIIRDPDIDPVAALALKRRIDHSNQDRTDLVEKIDSYFRTIYADVEMEEDDEPDFTGWTILDRGTRIGTCTGIEPIPGNPCLYVKLADGREPLIPLHEDFVASIDEASRTLSLDLPEGLY